MVNARLDRRIDGSLNRSRVVGRDQQAAEIAFAELLEQAAQLGLENDDRRRDAETQRVSQDKRNRVQPRQRGYQENEQQPDDALGQTRGARILQQLHQPVNDIRDNQDIDNIHGARGLHRIEAVDDRIPYIIKVSVIQKI